MTKAQYERLAAPFRNRPGRLRALKGVNRTVTMGCYGLYPGLLLWLLLRRDSRFGWALAVPGVSFALLTLFRRGVNRPRPYETLDFVPLIPKDTRGNSFPSRHVFSAVVIGMTVLWVLPPLGAAVLAAGAVLGAIRVTAGVHYPSDVLAGAAFGVLSGWVGLWLLPGLTG